MIDQIVEELAEKLNGCEWLHKVVGRGSEIFIYAKGEPSGLVCHLDQQPSDKMMSFAQSTYSGFPVRVIIASKAPKQYPDEIMAAER